MTPEETPVPDLYDVDLEQALIGACLLDNVNIDLAECPATAFYDPMHRRLWGTMAAMRGAAQIVSVLTVKAKLADDEGLAEVGGLSYLKSLARAAPALPNVAAYGRILVDLALRREADVAMTAAKADLRQPGLTSFDALHPVARLSDMAALALDAHRGAQDLGTAAMEATEAGEKLKIEGRLWGAPTGIGELDQIIGGLVPEQVVTVAGGTGMGKSILGCSVMPLAAATAGHPVEIFSIEMGRKQIGMRMACAYDFHHRQWGDQPLRYSRLQKGKAIDAEYQRAMEAGAALRALPIRVHDRDDITFAEIAAVLRSRAAEVRADQLFKGKHGIAVIDHLQIVTVGDRYQGSRVQELAEITKGLKSLAKRLGWTLVDLSQITRESSKRDNADRRPILSDLRDSGTIEQDSDVVVGLFRPAYFHYRKRPASAGTEMDQWYSELKTMQNKLEVLVLKNRDGEVRTVNAFCEIGSAVMCDESLARAVATTDAEHEAAQGLLV